MMGRAEAVGSSKALPGWFNSTKRFMSATRAEGVRWANVSALRAVRNFENDCSLCEQAADNASRNAAVGASGAFVTVATLLLCPEELLSWPAAVCMAKLGRSTTAMNLSQVARRTTLVLCRCKNGRQILREGGPRHNFIATRGTSLRREFRLHVREEADHAHLIFVRA